MSILYGACFLVGLGSTLFAWGLGRATAGPAELRVAVDDDLPRSYRASLADV